MTRSKQYARYGIRVPESLLTEYLQRAALPEPSNLQPGNYRHASVRGVVGRAENGSPRLLGLASVVEMDNA